MAMSQSVLAVKQGSDSPLTPLLSSMVTAAVRRQSTMPKATTPVLPRLLDALRRFYGTLQKHEGYSMTHLLRSAASFPGGAALVNKHLASLTMVAGGEAGSLRAGKHMLPRHFVNTVQHSLNAYPVLSPAQPFIDVRKNHTVMAPHMAELSAGLEEPPEALARAVVEGRWAVLGLGDEG